MQISILSVYSAISASRPAAVQAGTYRQLIKMATNQQSGGRDHNMELLGQALYMLSRHVQLQKKDHVANVRAALLVCDAGERITWTGNLCVACE